MFEGGQYKSQPRYHRAMCLIAFAWRAHPRYPLILVANRDEAHARASAPLAEWADAPGVFGGRDLKAGGTWLGAKANGRFAAVTNVREPQGSDAGLASRGALAAEVLHASSPVDAHAENLMASALRYGPFNLLLSDGSTLIYASNRPTPHWQRIAPGVHGLSNAGLDTPWPKTLRLKAALAHWIAADSEDAAALFAALADQQIAEDAELPDTGIGLPLERLLSSPFILGSTYGTRACSVLLAGAEGLRFEERRFGPQGVALGGTTLHF